MIFSLNHKSTNYDGHTTGGLGLKSKDNLLEREMLTTP